MHYSSIEPTVDSESFAYAMPHRAEAVIDPLDDVFASETYPLPSISQGVEAIGTHNAAHPSDMRRLQLDHTTAGYREGLSSAKEKSVQAGFDEGFSLGAAIGQESGELLGFIEGTVDALRSQCDTNLVRQGDLDEMERHLKDAADDLNAANLFSSNYWEPDGHWKYEVKSRSEEADILFRDIAREHPLVKKWAVTVDKLLGKWRIARDALDRNDEGRLREEEKEEMPDLGVISVTAKSLDW